MLSVCRSLALATLVLECVYISMLLLCCHQALVLLTPMCLHPLQTLTVRQHPGAYSLYMFVGSLYEKQFHCNLYERPRVPDFVIISVWVLIGGNIEPEH